METKFSLDALLRRRLLFVSGKGGVGKTTTSLALGLAAAQRGKKVVIAEVNSEEQIAHLLEHPPIGYKETELVAGLKGLWGINIDPKKSFEEYVLLQIRFRKLYKVVFENKYVRHFIEATPGLADLMSIGKIYALTNDYDLVIVDAPATGHGIALLEIASIVSNAVRVGPLRTEADRIDQLLRDPEQTQILLVTLPEEMPVTEALEMNEGLKNRLGLPLSVVFLNQFYEDHFTPAEKKELGKIVAKKNGLARILEIQLTRSELSKIYRERLRSEMPGRPVVPIPFLFTPHFGLSELQTVAGLLEARGRRS